MAYHDRFETEAGAQVYFCTSQRHGSAAPTKNLRLLHQYFPKGTILSIHSADEIVAERVTIASEIRDTGRSDLAAE